MYYRNPYCKVFKTKARKGKECVKIGREIAATNYNQVNLKMDLKKLKKQSWRIIIVPLMHLEMLEESIGSTNIYSITWSVAFF